MKNSSINDHYETSGKLFDHKQMFVFLRKLFITNETLMDVYNVFLMASPLLWLNPVRFTRTFWLVKSFNRHMETCKDQRGLIIHFHCMIDLVFQSIQKTSSIETILLEISIWIYLKFQTYGKMRTTGIKFNSYVECQLL